MHGTCEENHAPPGFSTEGMPVRAETRLTFAHIAAANILCYVFHAVTRFMLSVFSYLVATELVSLYGEELARTLDVLDANG